MKTHLWIIVALVSGLVGFLMGYSTSAYTGFRNLQRAQEVGTLSGARAAEEAVKAAAPEEARKEGEETQKAQALAEVQKATAKEETPKLPAKGKKAGARPSRTSGGSEAGVYGAASPASQTKAGAPSQTSGGSEAGGYGAAAPASRTKARAPEGKPASPKASAGGY